MDFKNKVIVVIGSEGLLGKAVATEIRRNEGTVISADVVLDTDISKDNFKINIVDERSVEQMIAEVLKKYHHIDGFVNNAYPKSDDYGHFSYEAEPVEMWTNSIHEHLLGFHICNKLILKQMKSQGFGSIVNIGSIYGVVGPDFSIYEDEELRFPSSYSMIKGGIINFTRFMASYYTRFGVRINCVSPGGIANNQPETFLANYSKKCLIGRLAQASEIAKPICFLLSEDASYIIGQNIIVDGGWTII